MSTHTLVLSQAEEEEDSGEEEVAEQRVQNIEKATKTIIFEGGIAPAFVAFRALNWTESAPALEVSF